MNETPPGEMQVGEGNPTIEKQTGVTIKLPRVFVYGGDKPMTTLVPGTMLNNKPVPPDRLKPYLVSEDQAVLVELPGHKLTYEMLYGDSVPVYCYLGVVPKGQAAYDQAKRQLIDFLSTSYPEASWEPKTIGDSLETVDYLEIGGPQGFNRPGLSPQMLPGKLGIYLVKKEHANVLVAYRGPAELAEQLSLFKAGEAALGTIESKPPAAESGTPAPPTDGSNS